MAATSSSGSTWALKFVTIADNSAGTGANIYDRGTTGAASFTSTGSVIASADASPSCEGIPGASAGSDSTYNATLTGDSSCGLAGTGQVSATWDQLALGALAVNDNPTKTQTMLPGSGSSLIDAAPNGTAGITIDQRNVVREGSFWIGAVQTVRAPNPQPLLAQTPVGCGRKLTKPKGIKRAGRTRLAKPGCTTNAGQQVKVKAAGSLRGDLRLFKLKRKANGKVVIRTYGYKLKLHIKWSAKATDDYSAYRATRKYRT
ncbi:MAG: hypothetical protein HQ526_08450 [Actinobacteria bacterium]|nr:hypothetical protein [Actinomycetota bacterium]